MPPIMIAEKCNACVLDCAQKAITVRIPLPAMMLHVAAPKQTGESETPA